jgi:hypothetical protein
MKPFVILVLSFLVVRPLAAQEPLNPSGTRLDTPEARAALANYRAAREAGLLPYARKHASPPQPGEQRPFRVFEDGWKELTFTLQDTSGFYYLWVEEGELQNGHVTEAELAGLRESLLLSTPPTSYNPGGGIIKNVETIFCEPPDYDGDGHTDLLLYDIGEGSGTTLGYFHFTDIDPNALSGEGNQADVLYLDASEGTSNVPFLASIAAHEYTHLVHARYGIFDTFVAEGLAEYAMVLNGYFWRNITYLTSIGELERSLLTWREGGGPSNADYQRAGLFFTYVATQVGPEAAGAILRTGVPGKTGIDNVLQAEGTSLNEVLVDFHAANYVNDAGLDPRYGYPMPQRRSSAGVLALPTQVFDGAMASFDESTRITVNPGGVAYLAWEKVGDFSLSGSSTGPYTGRAVLEHADGRVEVASLTIARNERSYKFLGNLDRLTLVLTHTDIDVVPGVSTLADLVYTTSWRPFGQGTVTASESEETLPGQPTLMQNFPNPFTASTTLRYDLPRAMPVRLVVYDVLGRAVATLVDGMQPAGSHEVRYEPGGGQPAGLYLYVLEAGGRRQARSMLLQ